MDNIFGDALDDAKPEEREEDLILLESQQILADLLEGICQERGIAEKDLAEILEMPEDDIAKMMTGHSNVTLRVLARLQSRLKTKIFMIASCHEERKYDTQPSSVASSDSITDFEGFQAGMKMGALAMLASFSKKRSAASPMMKSTVNATYHEGTTFVPLR